MYFSNQGAPHYNCAIPAICKPQSWTSVLGDMNRKAEGFCIPHNTVLQWLQTEDNGMYRSTILAMMTLSNLLFECTDQQSCP